MTEYYTFTKSSVGRLWVAWCDQGLLSVGFAKQDRGAQVDPNWKFDKNLRCEATKQLDSYFSGSLRKFDLPLVLRGTDFQKSVWRQLAEIEFGETTTYGELARRIDKPKASRAVGAANGQNRIAIVLPCHRVIGQNGHLTGFAGGIDIKEKLLRHEKNVIAPSLPGI